MASSGPGNWFAWGHFTGKEGVLGQFENLLGYVGSALSGQGISGYLSDTGSVYLVNNSQAAALRSLGYRGYTSEAEAIANPNTGNVDPAQLQAILSQATKTATSSPGTQAANTIGKGLNPFNWVAALTGINSKNLVVRSLKVIVGGVLLISGIVHMTGIDTDANKVLSKVPVIPV